MNNIDMASAGVFTGIGSDSTKPFMGVFDGQGYTISNLKFDATVKGTALFMNAKLATIKNLTVDTVTYEGTFGTKNGGAMIVGNADGCQLIGLTAKGANGATDKRVTYNAAGIVNELENAAGPCLVQNCTNEAAIYCSYTKAGGICPIVGGSAGRAGKGRIVIEGCVNKGTIDCTDGSFGMAGILGYSQNMTGTKVLENDEFIDDPELDNVLVIKNCVNTGTITGGSSAKIGGILGYAWAQNYNSTKKEKSNNYGVVIFEGENKCQGDYRTVGTISSCNTIDTLEKIVSDGRVIPAGTLAADNTYGILKASVKPEIELAVTEAISINSNGYTWDATGITPATGCKIVPTTVGNVTTYTCAELVKATAPTAAVGLTYTGETLTGVAAGTGYTLTGNTATDAGSYQATATLAEGYDCWSDDTTEPKTIDWSIAQATPTITTAPTASAEIEKDAALSTISPVGGVASTAGTFAWTTPETTVAEDGEFDVTFTPTDAKNYSTATCKVAVKVKAGQQDWPENPEDVKDQTAGEAFGLTGELATAAADKVAAWAKEHDVAFGDKTSINVKAMLLDIDNTDDAEAIAAAEAGVKFTAEDLAALMAGDDPEAFLEKYPYATVTIGTYADAACTTEWTEGDQKFYKATLTVPQVK